MFYAADGREKEATWPGPYWHPLGHPQLRADDLEISEEDVRELSVSKALIRRSQLWEHSKGLPGKGQLGLLCYLAPRTMHPLCGLRTVAPLSSIWHPALMSTQCLLGKEKGDTQQLWLPVGHMCMLCCKGSAPEPLVISLGVV